MEENLLDDDIKHQVTREALLELKNSSTWLLAVSAMSILLGMMLFMGCFVLIVQMLYFDAICFGFAMGMGMGGILLFYLARIQFVYSKAVYQLPVSTQSDDTEEDATLESISVQMEKVWRWGAVGTALLVFLLFSFTFLVFHGQSSTAIIEPSIPVLEQAVQADTGWLAPTPTLDTIEEH